MSRSVGAAMLLSVAADRSQVQCARELRIRQGTMSKLCSGQLNPGRAVRMRALWRYEIPLDAWDVYPPGPAEQVSLDDVQEVIERILEAAQMVPGAVAAIRAALMKEERTSRDSR